MKYFLVILGMIVSAVFLLVTLFIIPQYFFSKTIVKPSPDHAYEAHIALKRIPGGTLTELLALYSTATVRIYSTGSKKYIGSAITISGTQCIGNYGKKSELIQWRDAHALLIWCSDVHVLAKISYDRDFTTVYVDDDRIIQAEIYDDTMVTSFVNPRSIYE